MIVLTLQTSLDLSCPRLDPTVHSRIVLMSKIQKAPLIVVVQSLIKLSSLISCAVIFNFIWLSLLPFQKLSFREVKKLCSEQLQSLSRRRLESIITGKEMASSEDESGEEPENHDELETAQGQPEKEERKRKLVMCYIIWGGRGGEGLPQNIKLTGMRIRKFKRTSQ